MVDDSESAPTAFGHRHVPALPPRLAEPTPVVLAGTVLWCAGAVVFAVMAPGGIQFWTSAVGCGLGVVGYGVFRWQRSASRRGARGAWKGLSGLDG
ncbi:DUF2530 domain-containing protein [Saccharopolyspora erythraea]|uniref:DUF2530 domain-containing protein n=1 Tax=Saccharopolyspora erythraea TaxID=1836 RepID=UPI001BA53C79|nr:DUF2530 domain-containing protein [Saccharopolyspora erythraea]QUG99953.1 DUF2530 domain-containing protein [Saccharopolyspora erythraea]